MRPMDSFLRFITIALACLTAVSFAARADETAIRKALAARMPGLPKLDQVSKGPVKGLYELRFGNDVFYSDEDGNYLIEGQIIDTQTRTNVTQERIDKLLAIDFATLPFKDAVVWKQGTGERKLAVFADPNCGYCKRFERDLLKVKDVTVYTFLFPILGGDSPDKARDIWCSKNNGQTWRSWMIDGTAPPHGECDTAAIERNTAFGRAHHINGTPGLLFEDGRRVPGAMPPEDVEKRLAVAAHKS